MSHKDTLKLLFPLEFGGVFDQDIELEGKQFDDAQVNAELLLLEFFPQTATSSIADWERYLGVSTIDGDTLQTRQQRVIAKLRSRGGLSLLYFTAFAQTMGYDVKIENLEIGSFQWTVTVSNAVPVVYFRAGQSLSGDNLITGDIVNSIEGIFQELKPAYTEVIFNYI